LTTDVYADALERGFYGRSLHHWTRHFDPEQILVLQYERCVEDPLGELERTYRFLGLPPFEPVDVVRRVNESRVVVELPDDARTRLRELYAPDVAMLNAGTPQVDLSLWPNFASLARV
jgi:hypothetical protein